ncbi:MAG: SDR family NAD(P)-dependent oxidoreductase [Woeseiaceae bacterium]|nr:SDR family NAD(P)-dependent oxidoreductase [Woeseiaceae bacterium]
MSNSEQTKLNAVVVGASGGIGGALLSALERDDTYGQVFALARSAKGRSDSPSRWIECDILDESSIEQAFETVADSGPLGLVIVATGILHSANYMPEKRFADLSLETLQQVMNINAAGPALVAKHCLPLMASDRRNVFAALSARVGSIGDNRLGGWYAYRASKAALNMLLKTLSIEQARLNDETIIAGLHPGTVDTPLSKPFQRRVPDDELFPAEFAAGKLLSVLAGLKSEDSGKVYAWDGKPVPY